MLWSLLLLPSSCSKRTVFICFVSSLKLTRGSVCDETCLGNHLPWEGCGHPAQAASQLVQLQPWLLSPGPLQANPNHPTSRNTVFLCSQADQVDLSHAALHPLQHVQATSSFTWLHTSNPHFSKSSVPAASTGFSTKHNSAACTEPLLLSGLGVAWTAAALLTHGNQALFCQQVPVEHLLLMQHPMNTALSHLCAPAWGNFEARALLCTVPSPPHRARPAPCLSVNLIIQEKCLLSQNLAPE